MRGERTGWQPPAAVVGLFLAGYIGARTSGIWENAISDAEYVERIQNIRSNGYGHPGMEGPSTSASSTR